MKIKTRGIIFSLFIAVLINPAKAQEQKIYKSHPFQITLFSPLGTNGLDSEESVNRLSWNILWGISAGLEGFELGSIGNIEKDFVHGFQTAGIFNIVGKDVKGFQVSGLVNLVGSTFSGIQYAQFGNYNAGYTDGMQIGGFMNVAGTGFRGLQASGFINIVGDGMKGIQFSGFGNLNGGMTKGMAVSGFMNITQKSKGGTLAGFMNVGEEVKGIQAAGFINVGGTVKAPQIAGFMNVADNLNGMQASGFLNIAEDVKGLQASGFMNIAQKLDGVQFGVINVVDTVSSGVPIGILSIVKNGYQALELGGGPSLTMSGAFKIGIDHLYNIFSLGTHFTTADFRWAWGFGLGTRFPLAGPIFGSIEVITYHVNEGRWWTKNLNLLHSASFTFEGNAFTSFKWFAGPTFNVMVSQYKSNHNSEIGSTLPPWTVYDRLEGPTSIRMWPGVKVGIRF